MRRLPAALVALTAAATLALLASPASAAGGPGASRPTPTRSALASRSRCGARAAGPRGMFTSTWSRPQRPLQRHPTQRGGRRFGHRPRQPLQAGFVTIKLGTELIGEDRANDKGNFIGGHRIPEDTSEGAHSVSARCHAKFVGSQLIDVTPSYPAQQNLLTTDRTAVPAGQAVTISGTKCPTGKPSATLDGQRLNLAVNRSANGKGFTASSRMVPRPVDSPVYSGISNDTLTWL